MRGVNESLVGSWRYAFRPTVITTLLKRRKPRSIDAWSTLVMFLENATRGELAIRRTAVENAGSERIRLQSSGKDVFLPDINFSALSAMAGKGGTLSGSHCSSAGSAALNVLVARVIVSSRPGRLTLPCRNRLRH